LGLSNTQTAKSPCPPFAKGGFDFEYAKGALLRGRETADYGCTDSRKRNRAWYAGDCRTEKNLERYPRQVIFNILMTVQNTHYLNTVKVR